MIYYDRGHLGFPGFVVGDGDATTLEGKRRKDLID
jgi:hypothetical protein